MDKIKRYREMSDEKLEKELKNLKLEMMKAQTGMGTAKVGKDKEKGSSGSDIMKRLRREVARARTVLRERQINQDEK